VRRNWKAGGLNGTGCTWRAQMDEGQGHTQIRELVVH
jgi:hypothetical protein